MPNEQLQTDSIHHTKMIYGQKPEVIGNVEIHFEEMMFYQYLPIKMANSTNVQFEDRLKPCHFIVSFALSNFLEKYGLEEFEKSYVYLSVKHLFQAPGAPYNRPGWHSDGFMTNDINYIWSNKCPTVFNNSKFTLTQDDSFSLREMEEQALPENDFIFPNNTLLRLDQYNIHRVGSITEPGMRSFVKISVSRDKYDLIGNSHNYEFEYDWHMKPRKIERNIPQTLK